MLSLFQNAKRTEVIPLKKSKKILIKSFNRVLAVSLALVLLFVFFGFSVAALTLDCSVNDIKLINMPVNTYLIKNKSGNVVSPYSDYNIDYSFSTAEEARNLAFTLEAYTLYNSVVPTATTLTDQNGKAVFDDLEEGLYLILIPSFEQNGITYTSEPSLVMYEKDEGNEETLTVIPKITPSAQPEQTLKVLKIWNDDNTNRPDKITVVLLCDGKEYKTITLSEENNWRYTFDKLPGNHDWTIVELELEGYTVEVYLDGITFVIKNTKTTEPTPPTTTPDDTTKPGTTQKPSATKPGDSPDAPEKLPQTGQLWWPVPLMFFFALVFIILGILQRKGEHYEK